METTAAAVDSKPARRKIVVLTLIAPAAQRVYVTGSFCDWRTDAIPLRRTMKGMWKTALSLRPGRYEYRFIVDGEWRDDPCCGERVANPFGTENCILQVPSAAPALMASPATFTEEPGNRRSHRLQDRKPSAEHESRSVSSSHVETSSRRSPYSGRLS